MSINADQLRHDVIRPTLKRIALYSKAAENLLMGTAAQESHLGTYLRQMGGGPAVGIFQMEPATHYDLWHNYLRYKVSLANEIRAIAGVPLDRIPKAEAMVGNLYYATAMARIHYLRRPEALPLADNPVDLGEYWKRYFNTHLGRGTVDEFVHNYNRFVIRQ